MNRAASLLMLLAMMFAAGCRSAAPTAANPAPGVPADPLPAGALMPSRNLRVGNVLAVDGSRGIAIIELCSESPSTALLDGAPLLTRSLALRETARLTASRFLQGRTLGARIESGQPEPGDEVVFPAP